MITVIKKQPFMFTRYAYTVVTLGQLNNEYIVGIKVIGKRERLADILSPYFEILDTLEEAETKYEEVLQVMHELNRIRWHKKGATDGKEQQ